MIRPRKRFGQHFLEPAWVQKLLEVVRPAPEDVFLEIGPGRGALTLPLAARAGRVVAIEIDHGLAAALSRSAPPNVEIHDEDFLRADVRRLLGPLERPVRVVGNLPYNISSPILFRVIDLAADGRFFSTATVMLQKEVADRVAAVPGTRDYGVLSVFAQLHADITRQLALPPGAFRPAPRVASAVVTLAFREPKVQFPDARVFQEMVRSMFGQRRKTLGNALKRFAEARGLPAAGTALEAGIDPGRRPETLDLLELAALARLFTSGTRPDVL